LGDVVVYLVPIGSGRFELYSEPPADAAPGGAASEGDGFWRRLASRVHERWRQAAHVASGTDESAGRVVRARDWMVRRIAESIAEQRTLWSLHGVVSASFVYPSELSDASAAAVRARMLAHARRHHGWWLMLNVGGVAVTAILALLPGPNLLAYYFALRAVGHYLSWRGAREALGRTSWRARPEPALTEIGRLAHLPRAERAERVAGVAARLHLPRLAALFDRVAVPTR
jgi:hypothetical protein